MSVNQKRKWERRTWALAREEALTGKRGPPGGPFPRRHKSRKRWTPEETKNVDRFHQWQLWISAIGHGETDVLFDVWAANHGEYLAAVGRGETKATFDEWVAGRGARTVRTAKEDSGQGDAM
jgi:hypothetical protein